MGRGKVVKKEKYKDTKERRKRKEKYSMRPDRREIKRVFRITGKDEMKREKKWKEKTHSALHTVSLYFS